MFDFHDSMKNRWINNKADCRYLVNIYAPALSPWQSTLPVPCSHKLFTYLEMHVCSWKSHWWGIEATCKQFSVKRFLMENKEK